MSNLISNPSFETNLDGWQADSGSWTRSDDDAYDGSWSVKLVGAAFDYSSFKTANGGPIQLVSGKAYKLSFWAKGTLTTGGKPYIQINNSDPGYGGTIASTDIDPSATWYRKTVTFIADGTDHWIRFYNNGYHESTSLTYYFDQFELELLDKFDPSDTSCILALEFEDNVNDLSGNGNNGTWKNTAVYADSDLSIGGRWASLVSSNNISIDHSTDFNSFTALTISCWIKPDGQGGQRVLISKRDSWSATGIPFEFIMDGDDLSGRIIGNNFFTVNDVITNNTLHHVGMTWDGTTLTLYVDGVSVGSATRSGSITNNTTDVVVGSLPSDAEYFNGYIDRMFVFTENKGAAGMLAEYNLEGETSTSVEVTPATQDLSTEQITPLITVVKNTSSSPSTQDLQLEQIIPNVEVQKQTSTAPNTQDLSLELLPISVTTTKNIIVTPNTQDLAIEQITPTVTADGTATITPQAQDLAIEQITPTVTAQKSVFINPNTQDLKLEQIAPSITVSGSAVVNPQTLNISLEQITPTVTTVMNVEVTPNTQDLSIEQIPIFIQSPIVKDIHSDIKSDTIKLTIGKESYTANVKASSISATIST